MNDDSQKPPAPIKEIPFSRTGLYPDQHWQNEFQKIFNCRFVDVTPKKDEK